MHTYIQLISNLANSLSRTFYVAMTNTSFDDTDYETESTLQTYSLNTRETDSATETGGLVFTYSAVFIATLAVIYNLKEITNKKVIFNKIDGTLKISESVEVITKKMIDPYRKHVTHITIPHGVTSIGGWAFSNCTSLTSINIPNSVTSIGKVAFVNCTSLTSINIPNSVTSIGNGAFSGCSSLTKITVPGSVTKIGHNAFNDCSGLTSISIPNSVTSIGRQAFEHCTGLTAITIPDSVTKIGFRAFAGCNGLTKIAIPDCVTEIEEYAFVACISLTSITIPNSVTEIGYRAFYGCTELKYIIVPEQFENQTSDFWEKRGVDINRTAIYGMQDLMQNTDLQTEALKSHSEGVNFPEYKSLTLLNPLAHVSVSALFIASSKLANLTSELGNLCLPNVVLSGGAGLVNATMDNWKWLFSPLGSNAYACADVLAEWLSIYDIAKIQIAKATAPSQEELQVDHDGHNTALESKEFEGNPHCPTLRNRHTTSPLPNTRGFYREDSPGRAA